MEILYIECYTKLNMAHFKWEDLKMNKNVKSFFIVVLFVIIGFILAACNDNGLTVMDVSFDESVIESSYEISDFNIEEYFLTVSFSDGSIKQIDITESMISLSDLTKLSSSGTHTIEIMYQGFKISITINLSESTTDLSTLLTSIYNTAVSEGNITETTYEEWFESIIGEQELPGEDEKKLVFIVADGYIQWQYVGETIWFNLIELSSIIRSTGHDDHNDKEVLFRATDSFIQWQYQNDLVWTNLVPISSLTGLDGHDGKSLYEFYLEAYPNYSMTEEVWLDDLVNDRLSLNKSINVYFNSQGGTTVEPQTLNMNDLISKPVDPIKSGYIFKYWSYENQEWLFSQFGVQSDITLIAEFDLVEYTIDYQLDLENVENTLNPRTYTIEDETFTLENPKKEGFVFTGWTSEGHTLPIMNVVIEYGSSGNLTYTANWYEIDELNYSSDNVEQDDEGVIEIFYELTINKDSSFLMMTVKLYSDGRLLFSPNFGYIAEVAYDIYKLDYIEDTEETIFISVEGSFFSVCKSDGTLMDTVTGSIKNMGSYAEDFGYGYYILSQRINGENVTDLYRYINYINNYFITNKIDLAATDGEYMLESIELSQFDLSISEGIEVVKTFLLDNPQIYWLSNTIDFLDTKLNLYVEEAYANYQDRLVVDQAIIQMFTEVDSLITSEMNQLEIAKTIHDYIILKVDYAFELDGVTPENDYWAHNIEGVVNGLGAVCEGYAETYKLLADFYGIHTISVSGTSNNQYHLWSLSRINEKYYYIDVTWDDAGGDQISYVYFGMNYDSISLTHILQTNENTGIDYLYELPYVSENDLALVTLYENGVYKHLYESIEVAFNEMINNDSDYILLLEYYETTGPIMLSTANRIYILPKEFPIVKSITIEADVESIGNEEIGFNWYDTVQLSFNEDISLSNDLTIKNITIFSELYSLYLNDYTLSCLGANKIVTSIFGDLGSVLNIAEREQNGTIIHGNINVDSIEINASELVFQGQRLEVNDLYRNVIDTEVGVLRISANFFGFDQTVYINRAHVDAVSELLNINNTNNLEVNIDEVIGNLAPSIIIRLKSLDYYPSITINGEINNSLVVIFLSETTYVVTDMFGRQVDIYTSQVNVCDFDDSLLTIQDIEMDIVTIYQDGKNITKLFEKNSIGEVIKVRDTYEEISNGVLVNITTSLLLLDYIVPDNVTEIGFNAFIGTNLSSIVIHDGVTRIEDFAFQDQKYLNIIELPSSIVYIGFYAFGNTNATISMSGNIETISENAFSDANTLLIASSEEESSYVLTERFTQILWNYSHMIIDLGYHYAVSSDGYAVVVGLDNYTDNVVLSSNIEGYEVIYFSSMLFQYTNIQHIILPSTLLAIPSRAFLKCELLESVLFESESSIERIGFSAFSGVEMDSIIIPLSVIEIGEYAFDYYSFTEIYDMKIYVEAEAQPSGWSINWVDMNKIDVFWGFTE